jgi:hypothetical protein
LGKFDLFPFFNFNRVILCTITGQQLFSLFGSGFFENVVEVFEGLSRDELVVVAGGHGLDGFDDFSDVKGLSQSVKRSLSVHDNR